MTNLTATRGAKMEDEEKDGGGSKSPGLLRRAFSSRKKKKTKPADDTSPRGSSIHVLRPDRSFNTLLLPLPTICKSPSSGSTNGQLKPPALLFTSDNLLSPDSCCRYLHLTFDLLLA